MVVLDMNLSDGCKKTVKVFHVQDRTFTFDFEAFKVSTHWFVGNAPVRTKRDAGVRW
jgi:hypothetical protein